MESSDTAGKKVHALFEAARQRKISVIGLLGDSGQQALEHCDLALVVPSTETGRIQESHITAGHAMMELIENALPESAMPAKCR